MSNDSKTFIANAKKLLSIGYDKSTWEDVDAVVYGLHHMEFHLNEYSLEAKSLAAQIKLKGIEKQHRELTDVLAGDLYTKDLNQTNEWFITKLKEANRL